MKTSVYSAMRSRCRQGQIPIGEFVSSIQCLPAMRTHLLSPGDYLITSAILKPGMLDIEKIDRLDCPEKGDFETKRGTTGPISGNLFMRCTQGKLVVFEGDRISTGSGSLYQAIQQWKQMSYPTTLN